MARNVIVGQTDYTVLVRIVDSTGQPITGLDNADIDLAYTRVETDNDVTTSDVSPASLSALTDAHSDWGFKEVSATDHPGVYRLDVADAVFATGAWAAAVTLVDAGSNDITPVSLLFDLTPVPSNVTQVSSVDVSGSVPDVNVTKWYGQSVPAPGSSGIPKVDIYAIASNVAAAIAQQNLLAFCPIVTVSTITDTTHLICSDAVQTVDNAFSPNRWLFCVNATTGTNTSLSRRIIGYTGATKTFILDSAFPDTVTIGDTFRVV